MSVRSYLRVAAKRAGANMPQMLEALAAFLRSNDGLPHSICNDSTAMASIAVPECNTRCPLVADKPPCGNEFALYTVTDDRQGT